MNKFTNISAVIVGLLLLGYIAGPRVNYETPIFFDAEIPTDLEYIEKYTDSIEQSVTKLKPNNQARIIWYNDSLRLQTEYSVVYLHGFSASQEEGDPVHRNFAARYGCNLYLSRLDDHGRSDQNSFEHMTTDSYIQSAEEAIAIGQILGKKVIVMGCSTGATLATILAAEGVDIHSLIFYSPNIDIADRKSNLLLYPWGKQMADFILGGQYKHVKYDSIPALYWNETYHTNGIFVVKTLIKEYMKKDVFSRINQPVFMGYYYKNETEMDKAVSVDRMLDFYEQLGTPVDLKRKVAFDKVGHHVISSSIMSKDLESVENETYKFAEEILGLTPVLKNDGK